MMGQVSDVRGQMPAPPAVAGGLRDGSIDAGLYLLDVTGKKGWSHRDIAYVCGCSRSLIWLIEQRAIRKIKKELARQGYRNFKDLLKEN